MKKVLFLFVPALFAFAVTSSGQPGGGPPSPEEMAKMETEQMKSELNLNSDQLNQVQAINLKYAQKMGEIFQQGPPGDFAEMQKKMETLQKSKRAELEKVLSPDQLKKYDEMVEERRRNMPGPPM